MRKIVIMLIAVFCLIQINCFSYGEKEYAGRKMCSSVNVVMTGDELNELLKSASSAGSLNNVMTGDELNELLKSKCVCQNNDVTDAAIVAAPIVGDFDLETFFKQIRVAELLSFDGDTYTGLYMPILSFKSSDLELINLVFGGAFKNTDAKGYPMVSVTLRIDGILGRMGTLDWIGEHFNVTKFPSIEFGPFASYDFLTPKEIYGFLFAKKF